MFEQFFVRTPALARQRNGPMAEERRRYLVHCADQQMAPRTLRDIATYILVVAKVLRLEKRPGELIPRAEIEQKAKQWAKRRPTLPHRKRRQCSRSRFLRYALHWLRFLGRLQEPTPPACLCADLITAFAESLHREKGLAPSTIRNRCVAIQQFLQRLDLGNGSLRGVTVAQIDQALLELVIRCDYARRTVQHIASDLRSFFQYAEARGWCCPSLAAAIKGPRVFAHETLPVGPSWDDVRRLIATADGNQAVDIRDRALLMLLAVYGFRAGEVECLRLENFDWEHELLTFTRGKTRDVQTYPLARPVGEAILRYLREVRPPSARREVFLTCRAPFRPLSSKALGHVARRHLHALGASLPHYGTHVLRHACATHLLEQGLSLKEIGDHLGHRHPDTTRIYAKVDLTGLRCVADFDLEGLL
jgi:site-specific recombinase XerD